MNNYQQLASTLINGLNNPYQQKREIVSVNGITGARNFTLERGENILLMDANEDIVYVKTCDETGRCNLKVFSCTDITDSFLKENTDSVNKKDIEKLSSEVAELKNMIKGVLNEHDARE